MPTVSEGRFPLDAWAELFPGVPYPVDLSDDLVRAVATIRVYMDGVPLEILKYLKTEGKAGASVGLMSLDLVATHARQVRDAVIRLVAERQLPQEEES